MRGEEKTPRIESTNNRVIHFTGFETHRDVTEGSWFVQELCNVFAKHAHNTDLEVMLKLVMGILMNEYRTEQFHLQTPSVESWGFRSALYFNPGHYPTNP